MMIFIQTKTWNLKKSELIFALLFWSNYSVLKATTGSLLAAILLGNNPAINVSSVDNTIKNKALVTGSDANPGTSIKFSTIRLIGIFNKNETIIPNIPAVNPISKVSALKILDISFFLAPKLLIIPISLVLSTTDT